MEMQQRRESIQSSSEIADIARLAKMIDEGNDLSYREWKGKVKRKASVCIAEHLLRRGVKLPEGEEDSGEQRK